MIEGGKIFLAELQMSASHPHPRIYCLVMFKVTKTMCLCKVVLYAMCLQCVLKEKLVTHWHDSFRQENAISAGFSSHDFFSRNLNSYVYV